MAQTLGGDAQAPTRLATPERNHYYYGKLLDVSHFQLEQNYLNAKRWLMTRLIGGAGVVCGLSVSAASEGSMLAIDAGVAVDGWGREIIAPSASVPFDPRALTDENGNPAGTLEGGGNVTVAICYRECGVDLAPVLVAGCDPEGDCAPSITRESYTLVIQEGVALPNPVTCGFSDLFTPTGESGEIPDIRPALSARAAEACTEPVGRGCILLAQVAVPEQGAITAEMIDNSVRPVVVGNELLLELIFCLAQRVQQLASGGGPAPTPTPTPTPEPTPEPTPAPTVWPTPTPEPDNGPRPTVIPTRRPQPTVRPEPTLRPQPTLRPSPTPRPTVGPRSPDGGARRGTKRGS